MCIHQVLKAEQAGHNVQDVCLVQGACCADVHMGHAQMSQADFLSNGAQAAYALQRAECDT